ncbi:hypothetical protein GCM10007972_10340 [Iodidimonas muriae]|uniref:Nudix hydrolase domain-containing protein n=1 Tax=Iodidimonas muriae TaxID=261467 RepID=A0ABQ2LDE4_9PROT|nr:NUDIX hydrolase [Iodidimonas muriae]GER08024.1 hypothetical protein JCM17843_23340 [Kordiimonadales bacterium JCM 17843]GGO09127.1 hypothetical protein GCM10007972_10340 [Iodidimonas muriae]
MTQAPFDDLSEARINGLLEQAQGLPVSVKAVLLCDEKALVLRQPNGIWELPGGRLDPGEEPLDCLTREIREETGLESRVAGFLHSWERLKADGTRRFVLIFLSYADCPPEMEHVTLSSEHVDACFVACDAMPPAPIFDDYMVAMRMAGNVLEKRSATLLPQDLAP